MLQPTEPRQPGRYPEEKVKQRLIEIGEKVKKVILFTTNVERQPNSVYWIEYSWFPNTAISYLLWKEAIFPASGSMPGWNNKWTLQRRLMLSTHPTRNILSVMIIAPSSPTLKNQFQISLTRSSPAVMFWHDEDSPLNLYYLQNQNLILPRRSTPSIRCCRKLLFHGPRQGPAPIQPLSCVLLPFLKSGASSPFHSSCLPCMPACGVPIYLKRFLPSKHLFFSPSIQSKNVQVPHLPFADIFHKKESFLKAFLRVLLIVSSWI